MTMYYGLATRDQALQTAIAVNNAISPSSGQKGVVIQLETACAETLLGTLKDRTDYAAGTGFTQVDYRTFKWLKKKYKDRSVATRIREQLDVDIAKVEYRELEHSPLLASIWCRLRYLAVSDPIPDTLEERAPYWKKWYNSSAGKGTVEDYISKCAQCDVQSLLDTYYK
ncbi:TPA: hypothetical protein ACX6QP_002177 [Photobacterium damselae]